LKDKITEEPGSPENAVNPVSFVCDRFALRGKPLLFLSPGAVSIGAGEHGLMSNPVGHDSDFYAAVRCAGCGCGLHRDDSRS
jgi:hypothetical protein